MTDHDQSKAPTDADELRPTPLPPAEALVDEASDESFPASDPPSYPAAAASRTDEGPVAPELVPDGAEQRERREPH